MAGWPVRTIDPDRGLDQPEQVLGVEDRDYARWTNAERDRYLSSGSGVSSGRKAPGGLLVAVAVSAAVILLGQFPRGNPVVPALHFNLGVPRVTPGSAPLIVGTAPATVTLTGPTTIRAHSFMSYHGPVPIGDEGPVRVVGSLNSGPWQTLAVADGSSGSYLARVAANDPGTLRIRIVFKDGAQGAQTLRVLPG